MNTIWQMVSIAIQNSHGSFYSGIKIRLWCPYEANTVSIWAMACDNLDMMIAGKRKFNNKIMMWNRAIYKCNKYTIIVPYWYSMTMVVHVLPLANTTTHFYHKSYTIKIPIVHYVAANKCNPTLHPNGHDAPTSAICPIARDMTVSNIVHDSFVSGLWARIWSQLRQPFEHLRFDLDSFAAN